MHFVRRGWALLLVMTLVGCGSSEPDGSQPPTGAEDGGASTPQIDLPATADLPTRADGTPVAYKYRLTCDSHRTAAMPDGQQSDERELTECDYTWQWLGNEARLVLHGLEFQRTVDDQPSLKSSMSATRLMTDGGGITHDKALADLEPQWQEVLGSSFDTPICDLAIDEAGNPTRRAVTDRPGAKMVFDRGIVANTQLFQGPFPGGKGQWEAAAEIAAPHHARGTLAYEVVDGQAGATDDLVEVRVLGTLTGPSKMEMDETETAEVSNVSYTLEGTIFYSRRLRQWVAGSIEAELTFDTHTFVMQQKIPTRGNLTLTMRLVGSEAIDTSGS